MTSLNIYGGRSCTHILQKSQQRHFSAKWLQDNVANFWVITFFSSNHYIVKWKHVKLTNFIKRLLHVGNNLDPILEEVDNLRGLDPVEAHDVHPDDLAVHTHAPDAVAQGAEVLDVDLAKENSK